MPRVLVTERIDGAGLERLRSEAEIITLYDQPNLRLDDALAGADGVVVRISRIERPQIEAAPRLRVIGKHGIGVDNVDVAAATERRIPVVFTPGSNEEAVAEHSLTLMLMLARRVEPLIALARAGRFDEGRRAPPGFDLHGKTLGLIGMGRIGGRLAALCRRALDMRVLAYDPYAAPERAADLGVELRPGPDDVLRDADVVSIHAPLTAETHHLIDRAALESMKPGAFLINCARGGLVDEAALVEAVRSGRLGGAGIDVFEVEPPPADHPLLGLPNVIVTPHVAGSSLEAARQTALMVAEETLRVLRGERPRHLVNPEVLD